MTEGPSLALVWLCMILAFLHILGILCVHRYLFRMSRTHDEKFGQSEWAFQSLFYLGPVPFVFEVFEIFEITQVLGSREGEL